jgi:hypothetical protein
MKEEYTEEKEKLSEKDYIEEEKKKIVQMSQISVGLDGYDDIFSDFDPRPYSQRALSDDFLIEAKKASVDKDFGTIELKFLVPKNKRSLAKEFIIKRRLREHFRRHSFLLEKETKNVITLGSVFTLLGIIVMFITSYILFYHEKKLFLSFLIVLLEPAGWFLFWEGSHIILFESKEKKPDLEFYRKMSKCEITFLSY